MFVRRRFGELGIYVNIVGHSQQAVYEAGAAVEETAPKKIDIKKPHQRPKPHARANPLDAPAPSDRAAAHEVEKL
jgi:hypothetical protein